MSVIEEEVIYTHYIYYDCHYSLGGGLFTLPRLIKSGTEGMNKELQLNEVRQGKQLAFLLSLIKSFTDCLIDVFI